MRTMSYEAERVSPTAVSLSMLPLTLKPTNIDITGTTIGTLAFLLLMLTSEIGAFGLVVVPIVVGFISWSIWGQVIVETEDSKIRVTRKIWTIKLTNKEMSIGEIVDIYFRESPGRRSTSFTVYISTKTKRLGVRSVSSLDEAAWLTDAIRERVKNAKAKSIESRISSF